MKKRITALILLFIFSIFYAQEDFQAYYFPMGKITETKVYQYIDKNDPDRIEYWKVTSNPETNTILTESFNTDFRLYNEFEEELTADGAKLIRYTDFDHSDTLQIMRIEASIVEPDVFKWNDIEKYSYSVIYSNPKRGKRAND